MNSEHYTVHKETKNIKLTTTGRKSTDPRNDRKQMTEQLNSYFTGTQTPLNNLLIILHFCITVGSELKINRFILK